MVLPGKKAFPKSAWIGKQEVPFTKRNANRETNAQRGFAIKKQKKTPHGKPGRNENWGWVFHQVRVLQNSGTKDISFHADACLPSTKGNTVALHLGQFIFWLVEENLVVPRLPPRWIAQWQTDIVAVPFHWDEQEQTYVSDWLIFITNCSMVRPWQSRPEI